jgi:hypothetical protein
MTRKIKRKREIDTHTELQIEQATEKQIESDRKF